MNAEQHLRELGAARAHQAVDPDDLAAAQARRTRLRTRRRGSGFRRAAVPRRARSRVWETAARPGRPTMRPMSSSLVTSLTRPALTDTPSRNTAYRSASSKISSNLWLMNSSAQPASRSLRTMRNNSAHSRCDSDAVGSSKMSTRDSCASARAICITCFCAMLSRPAGSVGIEIRVEIAQARPPPARAWSRQFDQSAACRLRIHEQVFGDREIVERQAFLVNHADAQSARAACGSAMRTACAVEARFRPRRVGRRPTGSSRAWIFRRRSHR